MSNDIMSNEDEKIDISIREDERDFLKNKMLDLEKQFNIMQQKMDKILEFLEKDCKKMSDHIDFVENVYDNVKMPFYYVMDKVNYIVSGENKNILHSDDNVNKNILNCEHRDEDWFINM